MLKRKISNIVNNIIEECYSVQITNRDKQDEMKKIIDEAQTMFNDLLARVQAVKSVDDNLEKKRMYDAINSEVEKASLNLMGKLNRV